MSTSAGYSGTPLPKKLGFQPGMRVLTLAAPDHYAGLLAGAQDVTFVSDPTEATVDAAHVFLHGGEDIAYLAGAVLAQLRVGGMLWVSWAKKSSKSHAGITEDDLRAAILPLGWVDVKVCAVDTDWSGLKFLKRKAK